MTTHYLFTLTTIIITMSTPLVHSFSSDYYQAFTKTLGINAFMTEDGSDCTSTVTEILIDFKLALEQDFNDSDVLIRSVVDFVDNLKYELSPSCRTFSNQFESFMNQYYGDLKNLEKHVENSVSTQYYHIGNKVETALAALSIGEDFEAGEIHANLLKMLIGINEYQPAKQPETKAEKAKAAKEIEREYYQEYVRTIALMNYDGEETISEESNGGDKVSETYVTYVEALISQFEKIKRYGSSKSAEAGKDYIYDAGEAEMTNIEDL